jgi:4,5-dihydroxyphthalate decarboxylase
MEDAMTDRKLEVAFWNYDRTSALADGTVKIEGADARFHSARIVTEIFAGMVRDHAFDVSELGFTYFLRTFQDGPSPYLALPVPLARVFRHSAIYINKASGISHPRDLEGKRIGELALYGHDAGVMAKGILADEFGVKPEHSRWIIGGIDFPMDPIDFVPRPVPDRVEVEWAGKGTDLGRMLENGDIDALISADVPKCVLEESPRAGRLFEDYEAVERGYFRRTGIFPIMHLAVVKRELAEREPDLVRAIYQAFCAAKEQAAERYKTGMVFNNMANMVPWLSQLLGENSDLLGPDWWPYGMRENRKAIDTVLRYHYEQGLTRRLLSAEEIFVPALLDT